MVVECLYMFQQCFLYLSYPLLFLLLSFSLCQLFVNFKVHLWLFYRPPSSNAIIFDTLFNYFESIDAGQLSNFILLGDFNVNYANTSNPMYHNLCTLPFLYCLTQAITGPTHEHDGTTSTIDLVFMSEPSTLKSCVTIPPLSNSDHLGIMVNTDRGVARGEHRGHLLPLFSQSHANIYHFLPYKYQHQVVTVVFRVKNDHRKADYKAICNRIFELCLDRAASCLESERLMSSKGSKHMQSGSK